MTSVLSIMLASGGGGSTRTPGIVQHPAVATFTALGSIGYATLLLSHLVRWADERFVRKNRAAARREVQAMDDEYVLLARRRARQRHREPPRHGQDITGE